MVFDSILFYRFLFATFALGAMMKIKKESFRIESRDIPMFLLLGLLYTGSAMFLFWGYGFMGSRGSHDASFYLSRICDLADVGLVP